MQLPQRAQRALMRSRSAPGGRRALRPFGPNTLRAAVAAAADAAAVSSARRVVEAMVRALGADGAASLPPHSLRASSMIHSCSPPSGQRRWHQTCGAATLAARISTKPAPVPAAVHARGSRQAAKNPLKMQRGSSQMKSG